MEALLLTAVVCSILMQSLQVETAATAEQSGVKSQILLVVFLLRSSTPNNHDSCPHHNHNFHDDHHNKHNNNNSHNRCHDHNAHYHHHQHHLCYYHITTHSQVYNTSPSSDHQERQNHRAPSDSRRYQYRDDQFEQH